MKIPFIITEKSLTMVMPSNSERINVLRTDKGFGKIEEHLKSNSDHSEKLIRSLLSLKDSISTMSKGRLSMDDDGKINIKDKKIPEDLRSYVDNLEKNNYNTEPLENFIKKVMQIPDSYTDASGVSRDNPWADQTRQSLFRFLRKHGYTICNDGDFLAEKVVKDDYGSHHVGKTGRVFYNLNTYVEMPRYLCNHNPAETCSSGLHVCADTYQWGTYNGSINHGTDKVLLMKINPKDVVSIPNDYDESKMRVCKMFVSKEVFDRGSLKSKYYEDMEESAFNEDEGYDDLTDWSNDDEQTHDEIMRNIASEYSLSLSDYAMDLRDSIIKKSDVFDLFRDIQQDQNVNPFWNLSKANSKKEIAETIEKFLDMYE